MVLDKKNNNMALDKNKNFNIIISGVGGQGLISLTILIAEAAFIEGYDVKTSEIHGLSQRGGSVQTHIRFGKKIYSPLVPLTEANLIIGLEVLEALRNIHFSSEETKFLINDRQISFIGNWEKEKIIKKLKFFIKELHLIPASEICEKKFNKEVLSGIYLLGYAVQNNLIPLKSNSILKAMKKVFPEKYLEINKKSFQLAKKYG